MWAPFHLTEEVKVATTMTGRKRLKLTPTCPPFWFNIKTDASKENPWLYTKFNCPYSSFRILPIIQNCGVNFMEEVYRYSSCDNDKETFEYFCLSEEQADVESKNFERDQPYFPGNGLIVFAPKANAGENWLRFLLEPVDDEEIIFPKKVKRRVKLNTMMLQPVIITLQGPSGLIVELDFYPGVDRGYFNPNEDHECCEEIESFIVYHALLTNSNANWSPEWGELLKLESPSLKIIDAKLLVLPSKAFELDYRKLTTTFTLVSDEGTKFSCHTDLLCESHPSLAKTIKENSTQGEMMVSESAQVTHAFLQHVYNPMKPLSPDLTLNETCGILALALRFQIFELIVSTCNRIHEKMDEENLQSLWQLCASLCPLKFKIQIVFNLWEKLVAKVRKCILQTAGIEIKYVKFDNNGYFLNLSYFAECGPSAGKLLEGLCTELGKRVNGESKEEYMKIQLLIKRFQTEVIAKLASFGQNPVSTFSSTSGSTSSIQ